MKIKVCGMKYAENISRLEALKTDYMGFIFYEKSPRFAAGLSEDVLNGLSADIIKTGVFVNEDADVISKLIYKYKLDAVQLHGSENPAFCELFKHEVQVIKAFGVNDDFDFDQLKLYVGKVDYFLFDTKTSAHGGSGIVFDWSVLDNYTIDVPFFLSGGLSVENIADIKKIKHPQFYGVDLNSRFEIESGLKDIDKLETAFKTIKNI
ncbi:phosphoribosylanthranilate isomerase [Mucilaginibacter pallidiroseus]|uniref:N-(5'-phosphoribosyl)anthranilate isomerase n=1 Tax=Mucilaginibacter pallidiroseus TaxID=2599295 RepID=A0A563UJ07_9SPHI|nr:phosphoribosylanthranilate isomerase [Mucilaginibacter pallidiroseus]TWR31370.1 phosphoribosylanthranilate isomerase [Mucilaginibacter pallidiroseus]